MSRLLLLTVCLSHLAVGITVINVIAEHKFDSDRALTFLLSKPTKYEENSLCGFGDFESSNPQDEDAPLIRNTPLLMEKTIPVGDDPVLNNLFFMRSKSSVKLEYVNAEKNIVLTSPSAELETDFVKKYSKDKKQFVGLTFYVRDVLCYKTELIFANQIGLLVLDDDLSDFHLSIKKDTLVISKTPMPEPQNKPVKLLDPLLRKKRSSPAKRSFDRLVLTFEKAENFLKKGKYTIHPLVPSPSHSVINGELENGDLAKKVIAQLDDKVIYVFPYPEFALIISTFTDGYSMGDFERIDASEIIGYQMTPRIICPLEAINFYKPAMQNVYNLALECEDKGQIII